MLELASFQRDAAVAQAGDVLAADEPFHAGQYVCRRRHQAEVRLGELEAGDTDYVAVLRDEHAAAPLYDEPLLLVARPFRAGADCYRLEAADEMETTTNGAVANNVTVESVWHSREFCNDVASSVLLGGRVYGFHLRDVQSKRQRPSRGEFKCLEPATGKVLWETDRTGHASVIAADGKLILLNDEGEVLLVHAAADRYEELARTAVFPGERCWTAPALHRP